VAAVLSSTGYVAGGLDYLARGVVGDLVGLLLLDAAALVLRARVEHEAAACLVLMIGVVLQLDLQWPLRLPEAFWWGAFTAGLGSYLVVRRHVCDRNRQESNQ